eukprot:Protomagalhaensia_wolfi_Nauph_80__1869@NODE_216_length_3158_cov_86_233408_g162_i0_p3_GENE_NODE_216_length_3158_cov_86_233408_g162_i0NODE_216_length_3158_cov_86_233408_g162_i0_p3_ORF_typecomplete_len160_score16_72SH3_1/PF00018_28/2_9e05SH3_2/PF07653_17/1_5e04SH3_2/PF07653_17/0_00018SH3_9/PF14604_6/0_00025_NODE_216_length_3158_cov_86_233408_g162_i025913070
MLAVNTTRVIKWAWHGELLMDNHCQCSRRVAKSAEEELMDRLFLETQKEAKWSALSFLDSGDLSSAPAHQYLRCDAGDQVYIEHIANTGWIFGRCLGTGDQGWFPTYLLAPPNELCANLIRLVDNFSVVTDVLDHGQDFYSDNSRLPFMFDQPKPTKIQ